jgi:MFS family permease
LPGASETNTAGQSAAFWRYWSGATISGLGTAVTSVALPLTAVLVVHASVFSVAAIAAAGGVPWLVLGLPAGVLVARLPLRGTQVAMDLVRALAVCSIPVEAWVGTLTVAQLIAVALLVGAASVLFDVANSTMLPAIVPREQLTNRNSFMFASRGVAQLAGPGLGGVLVGVMGAAPCLLLDGVSYVVSALMLWRLPGGGWLSSPAADLGLRRQLFDGFRFVAARPVLRATLVIGVTVNCVGAAVLTLTPLYLVRNLHEHAYVLGLVYAGEGAGALIGSALASRLSAAWGTARAVLRCCALLPLTLLLLPLASHGWGALPFGLGIVAFAGSMTVVGIVIVTDRQRSVPAEMLPRVLAITRFLTSGFAPLGALLAGGLATAFGVRSALVLIAVLGSGIPLSVWTNRELRNRHDLDDQPLVR